MPIIIEGIDATGKSTLARALVPPAFIVESEGPPKWEGELEERIARYDTYKGMVFVRHPCVSDPIYSTYRPNALLLSNSIIEHFYSQDNLFVYCDPGNHRLRNHEIKPDENPNHIAMVEARYDDLLNMYRRWAIRHAHYIYRIGDDLERLCSMLRPLV